MSNYHYAQDGDLFVLYQDNAPLTTPDGIGITTTHEELAQKLVAELQQGKTYTSAAALLAYHYTYCNLEQDEDGTSDLLEHFQQMTATDYLMMDEYLMFRQPSPLRQVIAQAMSEEYEAYLPTLNLYQLTAILVVAQTYQSMMLPYYLLVDICEALEDGGDYAALKSQFMEDIEAFEREQGYAEEYEDYAQHLTNMSGMIDAFVYYYQPFCRRLGAGV